MHRYKSRPIWSRQVLPVISLLCGAATLAFAFTAVGEGSSIYVFRERDGVIRFTNRTPPKDVKAEVFTAKGRGVSFYSFGRSSKPGKLFPNLYNAIIESAAKLNQVDAALIKAVIHVESAFNPRAVSPKGARGLMQLMPGTARDLGVPNSFNPQQNIHGGARYLAQLLKRHQGNVQHALAAYNAGPENVIRHGGIPPFTETINYVRRVMAMKRRYIVAASATS